MKKRSVLVFIFTVGLQYLICSQEHTESTLLQEWIDFSVISSDQNDFQTQASTDAFYELYEDKIDVNKASEEQWKQIPYVTDVMIQKILNYRVTYGDFLSLYELQSIQEIEHVLPYITPFLRVQSSDLQSFIHRPTKNQFYISLSQNGSSKQGFLAQDSTGYLGSPHRLVSAYKYQSNTFKMALSGEKDPGEALGGKYSPKGFDFYSGHLEITSNRLIKKVMIGDYHIEFGQGLSFWTSGAPSSSSNIYRVAKKARGIRASSSLAEYGFLRGLATCIEKNRFSALAFASSTKVDARLSNLLTDSITSVLFSGYHRTQAEQAVKDQAEEQTLGMITKYQHKNVQVSAIYVHQNTSYNLINPKKNTVGLSYDLTVQNSLIFGEISNSLQSNKAAFLQGILLSLHSQLSLLWVYRYYPELFEPISEVALHEKGVSNEKGWHTLLEYTPSKRFKWVLGLQTYQNIGLSKQIEKPSEGKELFMQGFYYPTRKSVCMLYFKTSHNWDQYAVGFLEKNIPKVRRQFRINFHNNESKNYQTVTHIEATQVLSGDTSWGYLVYQDIMYKPSFTWSITGRFSLFEVENYEAGIFTYERNILYASTSSSYRNSGVRWMCFLDYKPNRYLKFQAKMGQTIFSNQNYIGSGLDKISKNYVIDLGISMLCKF